MTSTAKQNKTTLLAIAIAKANARRVHGLMAFGLRTFLVIIAILNSGCMAGRGLTPARKSLVTLQPAATMLSTSSSGRRSKPQPQLVGERQDEIYHDS